MPGKGWEAGASRGTNVYVHFLIVNASLLVAQ